MRIASILLAATALATVAAAQTAPTSTPAQLHTEGKAAAGPVHPAGEGKPQIGTWGFDIAGMDKSVKPGVDFYDYANGGWMKTTQIPADRASYGMFTVLDDLSRERSRTILEEAQKQPDSKIGNFYASFMDEAAAQAKGDKPIQPWIAALKGATDRPALFVEVAKLQRMGAPGPFGIGVDQDAKAPDRYIAGLRQGGLGLPDRDYYLKDDPKLAETRTAYVAYLAKLLTLAGEPNAQARAQAVMALETKLATAHWTRIESRDSDKTYNKMTPADLATKAPGFAWPQYLDALGLSGQPSLIVGQPSAFTGEAQVLGAAPLPVLKDYAELRLLDSYAPYLSNDWVDTRFDFRGKTLSGQPENQVRWKRAVSLVNNEMGEAVGKEYVARYFPPASKAAVEALVENLRKAWDIRLQKLTWMDPATKAKAREKLASFHPKIGYPDTWRDYSALEVKRDDLVGNNARAEAFEYQRNLNKLGHPIDRGEWGMTPMTINAYANFSMDEVVFPAAILQPPFFDPHADAAVNYGGIGAVIGHELSHHFDDQGSKYDRTGALSVWWTPQDISRFKGMTDRVIKQYDGYEPLPGQHVQGALTLGENMADLAGVNVALDAYHLSLNGKPASVLDGFTGDQRFFLGWGQVWRTKYREPQLRMQLLSDPHSPATARVSVVRNLDAWYKSFDVTPGQTLYLAPADRLRVW